MVFLVVLVLGLLVGGAIVESASWCWVFFSSILFVVVVLVLCVVMLRILLHFECVRSVDYVGVVLFMVVFMGLIFVVVEWGDGANVVDFDVVVLLLVAIALGVVFACHELHILGLFLLFELLCDCVVWFMCIIGVLIGVVHFGSIIYVLLFV